MVIPSSQPQIVEVDMIAAMFQKAMESLVEKIQSQPQMGHYKRDFSCNHRGPSQTSTSMNGTPTKSDSYAARDNSGPAGRGAGNKSTSDKGSGAVGRGQS
ncbi:hypothetical protein HAX54_025345 [Datura stramonium]|uniref:Uncharacterized protein n=1 Tax=Datura stramonium TaxID=4076 RepID=A0ABS8S7Q1_DATST|nr:hypothetical protein [Datura stramonium]